MLLETVMLTVALISPKDLSSGELVRYYWDCDTLFMKNEMGGQDIMSCLAITEELQQRVWNGDKEKFLQWWRERRFKEWERRGYYHEGRS